MDVPFNAGDFTANGAMTWTVQAGDVTTFQVFYHDTGTTVVFTLVTTTVGGVANSELRIAVPFAGTIAKTVTVPFVYTNSGTETIGVLSAIAGNSFFTLKKAGGANWGLEVNLCAVAGEITYT
jgi:cell division protein FtsW (lipid II flippase)